MKLRLFLVPLILCAASAFGQVATVTLSASHLANLAGQPVTGKLCLTPNDNSGNVQSYVFGGGGQGTQNTVCIGVNHGVLDTPVVDVALTNPQNICLAGQLINPTAPSGQQLIRAWECLQPASTGQTSWCTTTAGVTTCNLDNYITPSSPGTMLHLGPPGVSWKGAYNAATTYGANDGVNYGGSSYVSATSNNTTTPPGANWILIAQAGAGNIVGLSGDGSGNAALTGKFTANAIAVADAVTSGTPLYDVRAFGAVSGSADVTSFVQSAITAASGTGGTVYFPVGVWNINGPINPACDAIICLPSVSSAGQAVSVRIQGATRQRQDEQGTSYLGSLIVTTTNTGTDGSSAIFGVPQVPGNFGGLNNLDLYVSDLTIRTYPNPKIGCIDAYYASGAAIDHIRCEVGESYTSTHTQPTFVVSAIQLPTVNNDALSRFTWSQVSGYYRAVVAAEHAYFQGSWLAFGIQGLYTQFGYYPISGKIGMEEIGTPLIATGGTIPIDLELGIELAPSTSWNCQAWCYSTTDVSDPNNYLHGLIRFTRVISGVGNTTSPLSVTGGANLSTYNQYTQMWTNNASPRTQNSVGVTPTPNGDGLDAGIGVEYAGSDFVLGFWPAAGSAGVLQCYTGAGTSPTLGTSHCDEYINPFGGSSTIGNGGSPTHINGSVVDVNGVGLCLANGAGCMTVSGPGCTISAGAIGNACAATITIPTQANTNYKITGCTIANPPATGSDVIGALGSFTTTSFSVTEIALSITAVGGGTITCSLSK